MKTLTIRNLPDDVAKALEREKANRNVSLNQTVVDLLSQSLGMGGVRSNGLGRLAGTWTEKELRLFERAVAVVEKVDDELWR